MVFAEPVKPGACIRSVGKERMEFLIARGRDQVIRKKNAKLSATDSGDVLANDATSIGAR